MTLAMIDEIPFHVLDRCISSRPIAQVDQVETLTGYANTGYLQLNHAVSVWQRISEFVMVHQSHLCTLEGVPPHAISGCGWQ